MISWMHIIDIGHTAVMVPVAGAIAAWLLVTKGWRLAFWWCAIFATGLSVVAMSKIAYLGWGLEIRAIDFKAMSGHTWRATAVLPALFFVSLQSWPLRWRAAGVLLGVALSIGLAVLLVIFNFHTTSEVVASFILGIVAGTVFMRVAMTANKPGWGLRLGLWTVPASLLTFAIIWSLKPSSIAPRLVDIALYLSGRDYPYRWSADPDQEVPRSLRPNRGKKECLGRILP